MREPSRILSWLATIPDQPPNPTSPQQQQLTPPARKRKACAAKLDQQQHLGFSPPLSPPCSDTSTPARHPAITMDDSEASQARQLSTPQRPDRAEKRRHTGAGAAHDDDDDADPYVDTTPRPPMFQVPYLPPSRTSFASSQTSPTHSTSESQSAHSEASSRASSAKRRRQSGSPRKQKMILEFEGTVVDANMDGAEAPPDALNCLLSKMRRLADGEGIIHESEEPAILEAKQLHPNMFQWARNIAFARSCPSLPRDTPAQQAGTGVHQPLNPKLSTAVDDATERQILGPTPQLHEALRLWHAAQRADKGYGEDQWNCAVHYPILELALGHDKTVGYCSCTSATLPKEFAPRTSTNLPRDRRVDFCVHVEPESLGHVTRTLLRSPSQSINHTEFPALLHKPIGIAIETKLTGADWETARVQIGIWLAAQWNRLDDLVWNRGIGVEHTSPATAAGLVFLPAVIIQGHEWSFVALTRDRDGVARLWCKLLFASTWSIRGVYQAVAGLQLLSRWMREEYWPWFRQVVLGQ
ncbi:hypothetical protein LY78DRAFT_664541 [Colletotrichum sublineola]|nr:hypothetical protein LY78DRAFT_664541 [Colletotrichum sublineola]